MSQSDKPNHDELKKKLTSEQYDVMYNDGTEPAFKNEYWNNKEAGIYVDRVTGKALFSSLDKYDSGTGWPSFTKPIEEGEVDLKSDRSFFMTRTEVRSSSSDAHLGHVFDDGPGPGGKRFCMNSASLLFVPVAQLEERGYGKYKKLFEKESKLSTQVSEAMFGAGCFWGVEEIVRKLDGVISTDVGYAGGQTKDPGYNQVKTGVTGHAEVVYVKFDPSKITYDELLKYFFRLHDPTTLNRQGNDVGTQYRSVIFTKDESQRLAAQKAIAETQQSDTFQHKEVVTKVVPWQPFYKAEEYHQDYLEKNPGGYTCHWLRNQILKRVGSNHRGQQYALLEFQVTFREVFQQLVQSRE